MYWLKDLFEFLGWSALVYFSFATDAELDSILATFRIDAEWIHMRNIDFLCNSRNPDFTFITLSTTSWMVPLAFPSWDMERRSVSMAWWLEQPSRDSPFTATSWSLTHNRPSCQRTNKGDHTVAATGYNHFCGFVYVCTSRSEPWTHSQDHQWLSLTHCCFNMLPPLDLVSSVFWYLTAQPFCCCPLLLPLLTWRVPDNIWSPCTQRLRG